MMASAHEESGEKEWHNRLLEHENPKDIVNNVVSGVAAHMGQGSENIECDEFGLAEQEEASDSFSRGH